LLVLLVLLVLGCLLRQELGLLLELLDLLLVETWRHHSAVISRCLEGGGDGSCAWKRRSATTKAIRTTP
jgi:hypothetical protein